MFFRQSKLFYLVIMIMMFGLVLAGCSGSGDEGKPDEGAAQQTDAAGDSLPDSQVAVVNGEVLERAEFDRRMQVTKSGYLEQQGLDLDAEGNEEMLKQVEEMVLEEWIDDMLLLQQAETEGVAPSDAEVQEQIDSVKAQFPEEGQFEEALAASGMTVEELKEQIANQMKLERFMEQAVPAADIEVSEEEIVGFYEEYTEGMTANGGQEVPALEDLRPQIKEMLRRQKANDLKENLLNELKSSSEIITNLK